MWLYAFDLEMAARCFREAIALDDNCAMAWWGLTYSSGIYYNKPWHRMQQEELAEKLQLTYDTARAAQARVGHVTRAEAMMVEALQARYQSPTPVHEPNTIAGTTTTPTPCARCTKLIPTTTMSAPCTPRH